MTSPESLEAEVARRALAEGLLRPGDAVLVAASAGADSTALAGLLAAGRRHGLPLRLVLGHVDHGWRGPEEAERDLAAIRAVASGLGLALVTAGPPADVRRTEDAARRFRYAALSRLAHEASCTVVATGHHLRDQAETFLLRLERDAGPHGLSGIPARRALDGGTLTVVRPLLRVHPGDLRAYALARGLPFRDDPTNVVLDRDRARVRARLAALGARERAATRDLAALADRLRRRVEAREEGVRAALSASLLHHVEAEAVEVDVRALGGVPASSFATALRVLGAPLHADRDGPWFTRRHAALAADLARGAVGHGAVALPHGFVFARLGGRALLARRDVAPLEALRLDGVPASVEGARATASRRDVDASDLDLAAWTAERRAKAGRPPWRAAFDAERLGDSLVLRGIDASDRFVPFGRDAETTVEAFLGKQGVPALLRRGTRVVEAAGGVAWVVGRRVDARCAVTPGTRRVAIVEVDERRGERA